jgi:hypothetical protein
MTISPDAFGSLLVKATVRQLRPNIKIAGSSINHRDEKGGLGSGP